MDGMEECIESIINSTGTDGASQSRTEKPPRINRVPPVLRDTIDFEKYYEARFVSIGPYHHGKPNLQQVQKLKYRIASKFASNDPQQLELLYKKLFDKIKEVKKCYDENLKSKFDEEKLLEKIKEVKECYDENSKSKFDEEKLFEKIKEVQECYGENLTSKFKDNELAKMMLLDGCFILYYIKSVVGEKTYKEDLEMKSHVITCVGQDLFLLENQLPFFVLWELIINSTTFSLTKDQWMESINLFIQKNIMAPQNKEWKELQPLDYEMQRPAHLLELLHQRMVPPIIYKHTWPKPVLFTFRSLKELTEVGIHLKPKVDKDQVTEISYHRPAVLKNPFDRPIVIKIHCDCPTVLKSPCCCHRRPTVVKIPCHRPKVRKSPCHRPTLKIPCITVDGSTRSKVLNLIAYEMCPDAQSDLVFTNYICFMDSLIDNPEDVKKLRSAKILQNCLHSDDDVAKLFNEIGANLVSVPFVHQYEQLIEEIQEDYENKKMRYMADFRAEHCKNPCTIFALIAAGILLILTAIQTYFQIWSSPNECDGLCKHIKMTHHI